MNKMTSVGPHNLAVHATDRASRRAGDRRADRHPASTDKGRATSSSSSSSHDRGGIVHYRDRSPAPRQKFSTFSTTVMPIVLSSKFVSFFFFFFALWLPVSLCRSVALAAPNGPYRSAGERTLRSESFSCRLRSASFSKLFRSFRTRHQSSMKGNSLWELEGKTFFFVGDSEENQSEGEKFQRKTNRRTFKENIENFAFTVLIGSSEFEV